MNGWTAALVGMVLVMNPTGVAQMSPRRPPNWTRLALFTAAAAGAAVLGIGLLAGPLTEALSISTPTFRLGAALVMGLTGAKWMLVAARPLGPDATDRQASTHLGTLLLAPGPVLTALASTGDAGALGGIVSVAVAFTTTLILLLVPRLGEPTSGALTRFVGALTLVAAIAIGLDSARTV